MADPYFRIDTHNALLGARLQLQARPFKARAERRAQQDDATPS